MSQSIRSKTIKQNIEHMSFCVLKVRFGRLSFNTQNDILSMFKAGRSCWRDQVASDQTLYFEVYENYEYKNFKVCKSFHYSMRTMSTWFSKHHVRIFKRKWEVWSLDFQSTPKLQNYKITILPKNLLKKSNFSLIQRSHNDHNFDSDVSLI